MSEIHDVRITPLRRIPDERGAIMHMLRRDDPGFAQFGEIYFSLVYPGVVKGWHLHSRMTLNYAVPVGMVKLVCYDERADSPTRGAVQEIHLGELNYVLVTIPPRRLERLQGRGDVGRRWWPTAPPSPTTPRRSSGWSRSRIASPTTGRCAMAEWPAGA